MLPVRRSSRLAEKADLPKKEVFSPVVEKKVKKVSHSIVPFTEEELSIMREAIPTAEFLLFLIQDISNATTIIQEIDNIFEDVIKIPRIGIDILFLSDVSLSLKRSLEMIEKGIVDEEFQQKFGDQFVNEDQKVAFEAMETFVASLKRKVEE